MGKNGRDQGRENDVEGLTWLHKFGWLRSRELTKLIFVKKLTQEEIKNENNIENSKKYAERLCNKWVKKGYVIKRKLPDSAGNAYVLAGAGVQFLADKAGVEAKSNKDWGETKNKTEWTPPKEWEHDLIAIRILIELHIKYEFNIIPEYQIRRENPNLSKIPDGLYSSKKNPKYYHWLEVERSRKTGQNLERMINVIYPLTTMDKQYGISNQSVYHASIAYDANAKDEKNHNINHKFRVISALKKIGKKDMQMAFIEFKRTSSDFFINRTIEKIENDEITRQVHFFEKRGWNEYSQGVQLLQMGDTEMWVRKQKDHVEWEVNDEQRDFNRTGTTTTISDAKRAVAAIYTEFAELLNRPIPHHLRRR